MRIKLLLSYDGYDFSGWQLQASDEHAQRQKTRGVSTTIQGTIEDALAKVLRHPVRLHGSGRTDAGAHAIGQVAHFDTSLNVEKYDLRRAITRYLPDSIVVRKVWQAPDDFHSLFQCTSKTYKYLILNRQIPSAIHRHYQYWVRRPLNLSYLNECTQKLEGTFDFKSFQTRGTPVETTIRTIFSAGWRQRSPHVLEFTITGSGFLKQMVRNIVGTAIDMNLRNESPSKIESILAAQNRQAAGPAAPAHGLYLYRVFYPPDLDNKCREL